jgi:hypothetical protein
LDQEVGKFEWLGRSGNLGGLERLGRRKDRQDLLAGNKYILQLHVVCVSYYSGDYRNERLVHSINVVIVVKILINISICQNPRQKPFWDTNTGTMISSDRDDENWDHREVGKVGRLVNLEGREVWKVWEGGRFGRILSPVLNRYLQLHVHCVSYHSGDSHKEFESLGRSENLVSQEVWEVGRFGRNGNVEDSEGSSRRY